MTKQLLEDVSPIRLSIEEGTGKVLIRGPFGLCGTPTANKRLYSRAIIESNIKNLKPAMASRRLFGELDHPADGKTSLKRVSHLITDLRIEDDGTVVGTMEPLPTPMGDVLLALAKANVELGVSSRGMGSVVNRDGIDEVQDDFVLKTYDVVADPASKNAYPKVVREAIEEAVAAYTTADRVVALDDLSAEDRARLMEQAQCALPVGVAISEDTDSGVAPVDESLTKENESLREQVSNLKHALSGALVEHMEGLRESVRAEERAKLLSDPEVAAAKSMIEAVAGIVRPLMVPEKTREVIKDLRDQVTAYRDALDDKDFKLSSAHLQMAHVQEDASRKLLDAKLTQMLAGHPKADFVRQVIGPVERFESTEELVSRVEAMFGELGTVDEFISAPQDDLKRQIESIQMQLENEKGMTAKLKDGLSRSVAIAKSLQEAVDEANEATEASNLRAYRAEAVIGRPDSAQILKLTESCQSEDEVRSTIDRYSRSRLNEDEEAQKVRARVQRGRSRDLEEEVSPRQKKGSVDTMFDISMDDLARLAGV